VLDPETQEVLPRRFTGVWLPAITPFTQGEIDHPAYARLIDHYVTSRSSTASGARA
jgi:dihydrodipicolinate synthase/N-acetylneuraminate lyase